MKPSLLGSLVVGTALVLKGVFTMKFTKKHQIVKSWVSLVNAGVYQLEDVPRLFNLREVVAEVLNEQNTEELTNG